MGRERYEDSKRGSRLPSHAEGNTARTTPVDHQQMTPLIATMTIRAITSSPIYLAAYVQQQLQSRIEGGEDSSYTTPRWEQQPLTQGGPHQLLSWCGSYNATVISQVRVQKGGGGPQGDLRSLTNLAEPGSKLKLEEELPLCHDQQPRGSESPNVGILGDAAKANQWVWTCNPEAGRARRRTSCHCMSSITEVNTAAV